MLRQLYFLVPLAVAGGWKAPSQSPTNVAFVMTRLGLDLRVDYERRALTGDATLVLRNGGSAPVNEVPLLLNRLMRVARVTDVRGRQFGFAQDVVFFADDSSRQVNSVSVALPDPVAPGDSVSLTVTYSGVLTGYTETGSLYIKDHVSRDFTIIREDAYAFPVVGVPHFRSMRAATREAFAFSARVTVPTDLVVAMGGSPGTRAVTDSFVSWSYRSTEPVPFLNITIAPYNVTAGKGFRMFVFPQDSAGAVGVGAAVTAALARLESWYGPLARRPDIAVMEIPEGFGSQASLSAGIILTADAFRDRTQLRQLYHELSHLWNVADTDVPSPRWNEGLATFLQYRLAAELDGWSDWNNRIQTSAQALLHRCGQQCATVPLAGFGRSSLTDYSYTVGFLMFQMLHEVLGSAAFDRAYRDFYQKHKTTGATTADLAEAFRSVDSRCNRILNEWLFSTRWHARLTAGESMAQIIASYRR